MVANLLLRAQGFIENLPQNEEPLLQLADELYNIQNPSQEDRQSIQLAFEQIALAFQMLNQEEAIPPMRDHYVEQLVGDGQAPNVNQIPDDLNPGLQQLLLEQNPYQGRQAVAQNNQPPQAPLAVQAVAQNNQPPQAPLPVQAVAQNNQPPQAPLPVQAVAQNNQPPQAPLPVIVPQPISNQTSNMRSNICTKITQVFSQIIEMLVNWIESCLVFLFGIENQNAPVRLQIPGLQPGQNLEHSQNGEQLEPRNQAANGLDQPNNVQPPINNQNENLQQQPLQPFLEIENQNAPVRLQIPGLQPGQNLEHAQNGERLEPRNQAANGLDQPNNVEPPINNQNEDLQQQPLQPVEVEEDVRAIMENLSKIFCKRMAVQIRDFLMGGNQGSVLELVRVPLQENVDDDRLEEIQIPRLGGTQQYATEIGAVEVHARLTQDKMNAVLLTKGFNVHLIFTDARNRGNVKFYHFDPQRQQMEVCEGLQNVVRHLNEEIPVSAEHPFRLQGLRVNGRN